MPGESSVRKQLLIDGWLRSKSEGAIAFSKAGPVSYKHKAGFRLWGENVGVLTQDMTGEASLAARR